MLIPYDKSKISEQKYKAIFQCNPIPSFIWQIVEKDLIFIDYNIEAKKKTEGQIENYLGIKASEMYKDQSEFINGMNQCIITQNNIIKEIESFSTINGEKKFLSVAFNFIPPDLVIVVSEDITRYKQITDNLKKREEQLKKSEERYRKLFEVADDAIFLINRSKDLDVIIDFNDKTLDIFGYENRDELIGLTPYDISPLKQPDGSYSKDKGYKYIKEVLNGQFIRFYWQHMTKDGTFIDTDVSLNRIFIENKYYVQAIVRDITEWMRAEQELLKSEEMYRTERNNLLNILNSMQDGVYIVNQYYDVEYANPALISVFGSFEGRKCYEYSHNRSQICPWCQINEILKGITLRSEYFNNKHQKTYDLIDSPLKKSNGSIALLRIFRDITEKKETEDKIKDSEKKFRTFSESSPAAIIIYQEYQCIYANPAAELITEYTSNELAAMKFWDFLHPEFKEIAIESGKAIEEGKNPSYQAELKIVTKNGKERWIDARLELIEYQNKRASLITAIDITDRKQLEKELIRSDSENKAILSANPDLIFEFDKDGIYKLVKGNIKDLYLPPEQLLGKKVTDLLPKDVGLLAIEKINKTLRTGENQIFEYGLSIAGEQRYWEARMTISREDRVLAVIREITSRKKAEQKLQESEENFRELFNSSTEMIFVHNIETGAILNVNKKACEIFGYTREELLSLNVEDISEGKTPYTQKEALELIMRAVNGYPQLFEWKSKKKDNILFWNEVNLKKVNLGGIGYVLATCRDITERKQAEEALRQSQLNLQTLFNSIQDFIFILNMNGHILEVNNRVLECLGYSERELLNMMMLDLHPPDRRNEDANIIKEIIEGKTDLCSIPIITKNGNIIPIETKTTKGKWGNQDVIFGISRDITERKEAEQKLKESEEKYRLITESAHDLIALVNQKYEHVFINEQTYMNILGYSKEDMLGKTRLDIIHPEDLERGINAYKTGLLIGIGTVELRLRHKQGHYLWFEFKGKKYQDAKDNLMGLLIGREITERKKAEQLILEENKKLLELDKIRKDIITRVSHELKTPLTSAFLASDLLVNTLKEKLNVDVLRYVQILHRNHIRLKSLIKNILDVSKIDFEKIYITRTKENLIELINESIDQLSLLAENRQIKINLNLPETIFFNIDKFRMEQVITNILSNAIKNTQKNGEIDISIFENTEYIDTKIKDTGVGLTSEEKQKLFKRFGKIERYGTGVDIDIEGVGLGLYISKYIMELHNGEILIESEGRNKGSTFIIRLFKNK